MKGYISIAVLFLFSMFILAACAGGGVVPTPVESPDAGNDNIPQTSPDPVLPGDVSPVNVTYNRIDWWSDMDGTAKVKSADELREFYEMLEAAFSNEMEKDLVNLFTGGQYNDDFFKENFLVLITASENSGSNRLELASIKDENKVLQINIDRILPEVGTADMAGWLIVIELGNDYSQHEIDVIMTDVPMEY